MFVLIERRNMISSGSDVPSSLRKKEIDRLRRDRSISRSRRSSSHQPASDVAQSTVRAPPATRQDREWHWCAYLFCKRKRRSNRVTATPVLNDREAICKQTHRVTQGICKSKQQDKHNTTINKCWSRVGAVITVTYGPNEIKQTIRKINQRCN